MSPLSDDELAALKAALQRSRRQPMNFAAVLGKQPEDHRLSLHATRAGRALAKVLKEATGSKQLASGMTEVDDDRKDTLVLVLDAKPPGGLAKKLGAWLKLQGMPVRKVALKLDGQDLEEDGTDEADVAPTAAGKTTSDGDSLELARLKQALDKLAPRLDIALGTREGRASLPKIKEACLLALQQGALPQARQALQLLLKQLQAVEQPQAIPVMTDKQVVEATRQLPKALGKAVVMVRTLQDDIDVQKDRRELKKQGDEVRHLVLQARLARKSGDAKRLAALDKEIGEQRKKVQAQLKALVPQKGANAGPDAWAALVARLDLASPKDGAVFWSGDKTNAIDLGQERDGISLESTSGGCLMDDWKLEGIPWNKDYGDGPPFTQDLWSLLSASYAMQAEGEITIVQTPAKHQEGGGEMWRLVERKVLLAKIAQGTVTLGQTIVREPQPKDTKG